MVETKGSVKLFGATIEVAAERGTWEEGKTKLSGKFQSILNQKPKVKIKGKEQEPTTPRENSEPAASSIEMEHSEEGGNSSKKTEEKQDGKLPNPREKLLKKPTKILPCPRCHSLDTKFCYFNNHNVNQPRHFCRACQRYWTDGGAMRNMPVGAGRRKSKSSPSQFRHMTLYGAAGLHSIPSNILEAYGHNHEQSSDKATPSVRNGMMPPDNPKDQRLNIDENIICPRGELQGEEKVRVFPPNIADAVQNSSSARDRIKREPGGLHGFQGPYLKGFPFPSTRNPPHAFCASYLPVSFYLTPSTSCSSAPPGPEATAMFGKHSRDGSILGRNHHVMACDGLYGKSDDKGVLLCKTTRIDDPSEASKCSAWDEIREKGTASRESCFQGLFGTFQPKAETVGPKAEISNVLHANPLALLRSLEFHENIQWRNDIMNASRKG